MRKAVRDLGIQEESGTLPPLARDCATHAHEAPRKRTGERRKGNLRDGCF